MLRLNNKDFTVEELERMIDLVNVLVAERLCKNSEPEPVYDELRNLVKYTTLMNDEKLHNEPTPITWNFKFSLLIPTRNYSHSLIIKNAMRDTEVNENIKRRFSNICYEEVNWYQDRIMVFLVKGNSNIME